MKTKKIHLFTVSLLCSTLIPWACVFCAVQERFHHSSNVFSVNPPEGFRHQLPSADGVQFTDLTDNSFLNISFSDTEPGTSDAVLLDRFKNDEFRKKYIEGLESSTSAMKTKVISSRSRVINDIAAWEFVTEGMGAKGAIQTNFIVLYKGGRNFLVIEGARKDIFPLKEKLFEESLATFAPR